MIQLIADPESHLNQVVKVSGWFNLYKLFVTEGHYSILDMSSSVDLAEPTVDGEMTEACESRYVTVTGTFVVEDFSYTIVDVSRVYDIAARDYCWGKAPEK